MKDKKKVPWPIMVRTRRLEIRPYRLSDYQVWRESMLGRSPKSHKYDRGPPKKSSIGKSFYRKLFYRHERFAKKDIFYPLGIFHKKTGAHLGFIDISTISRDWYQWASLGYFVHNTFQKSGFGKEAAKVGIEIAFRELGYKRVEASICPDNWRSIKLARSLGMKREGVRKEYIFENNRWDDHVIYSILNPRKSKRSYPMLK